MSYLQESNFDLFLCCFLSPSRSLFHSYLSVNPFLSCVRACVHERKAYERGRLFCPTFTALPHRVLHYCYHEPISGVSSQLAREKNVLGNKYPTRKDLSAMKKERNDHWFSFFMQCSTSMPRFFSLSISPLTKTIFNILFRIFFFSAKVESGSSF